MRTTFRVLLGCLIVHALIAIHARADNPPPATRPAARTGLAVSLGDFGPLDTPTGVQQTFARAVDELRKTGGVLVVPSTAWKVIKPLPLQGLIRTPSAPDETRQWKIGDGVTVVVADEQHLTVETPPLSGLMVDRQFRLAQGDSVPHWGTHPILTLNNEIAYGSCSFLDWLQEPVSKGPDRRFYVKSIRGIRPGMFLNLHGGPGYGGGVTRGCVKSLGYDPDKGLSYFIADTAIDHVAGAILHNKSNVGILHMLQTSNADNQTYDVKVIRNQYAHGDAYVYYCDFNYMSNIHSAAGDENGNCYAAFIRSLENNFRATVEAVEWEKCELKFAAAGASNLNTLGDSRPLINLNPQKAITAGTVLIVPAECYHEAIDTGKCKFQGQSYPTRLITNPVTGVKELKSAVWFAATRIARGRNKSSAAISP